MVPTSKKHRMGNLIVNPGFEMGLYGWNKSNHVYAGDIKPHSGNAVARIFGLSSLSQEVCIVPCHAFEFFFAVRTLNCFDPGDLIVSVMWMDKERNPIGPGFSTTISGLTILYQFLWLEYSFTTGPAPSNAAFAQIFFSKGSGPQIQGTIDIDDVDFHDQT